MRDELEGDRGVLDDAGSVSGRATPIISPPGLRLFARRVVEDGRGSSVELWRESESADVGMPPFTQDYVTRSRRGVVRGLDFQNPHSQAKLVMVVAGDVFDVVVDVRVGSPTFARWTGYRLSESNGRQLFVPPGFAHGYQALSETAVVVQKCAGYYAPEAERRIRWNDDALRIDWPITDAVVSARDMSAPRFQDLLPEWLPIYER